MKVIYSFFLILLFIGQLNANSADLSDIYVADYKLRLIIAPSFEPVTIYHLEMDPAVNPHIFKGVYKSISDYAKEHSAPITEEVRRVSEAEISCLLAQTDKVLAEINLRDDTQMVDGTRWTFESSMYSGVKLSIQAPYHDSKERGLTHLIELEEMLNQTFSTGSLNCSFETAVEA